LALFIKDREVENVNIDDQPIPQAGRKEWIGLAVISLPCLLYSMDLTVLNLAIPSLSVELKPSGTQLLWIVDIYGFMVAGSLITMGSFGDRIGRRRMLMFGAIAFGTASVLAAFSTSASMLIVTRAILGVAGATLAPSTLSLIRNMFHDPKQRSIAVGVWISSYSAGAAIGPPLGGLLLEYFWWGSVFLIGVPVMVLLLVLGPILLPEYKDPEAGRPDLPSAALSIVAVLTIIYGLKQIAAEGVGLLPLLFIFSGIGISVLFIRRQRLLADPLIDLSMFRNSAFSISLITYLLATFAAFGPYVFISQYLQLVVGLSPLRAGLWTMPFALAFIVGSLLTPWITKHVRPAKLIAIGCFVAAIGFCLLKFVNGPSGLELVVTSTVVFSLGLSAVFTLANDFILSASPPEKAGAASAISETSSEFGGAFGIAILGTIGTTIYRTALNPSLANSMPPEMAETARDTLAGALAISAQLPEQIGRALLENAQNAFTSGLQFIGLTTAAIMAITSFVVLARFVKK
jgi:DHA2 family multidrug resistance protein-like MFS transporter